MRYILLPHITHICCRSTSYTRAPYTEVIRFAYCNLRSPEATHAHLDDQNAADALRYMVLDYYGGLYLDLDIACYKSVDEWFDFKGSSVSLILQMGGTGWGIHNGVLAGTANHMFFKQALRVLRARAPTEYTFPEELSPLHTTGPELTDKAFQLFSPTVSSLGAEEWAGAHEQDPDGIFRVFRMGCWFIPCWWEDKQCQSNMQKDAVTHKLPKCVVGNHFSMHTWWNEVEVVPAD